MPAKIKYITKSHLRNLSRCHIDAFPKSLATALGQSYVEHMLSWYLSSEKVFIFYIENEEGNFVGYCGGMVCDGSLGTGSASGMAQHSFWHAVFAFLFRPWLIFHPEILAKWPLLWKNILMKVGLRSRVHFSKKQQTAMAIEPHVGLVVIGVHPAHQGKGYGSMLLKEFERYALEVYKCRKLQLSVLAENTRAITAYERNGWVRQQLNGNSLVMVKLL